ncbi:lipase [Actinosynnema sp. NPDC020468]|uniref:alpha/beta hydrolase family protein n=1 Tax=Actinosynnema sp. NPDC020468 TaxID=3154488 RepID=UPI0033E53FDD
MDKRIPVAVAGLAVALAVVAPVTAQAAGAQVSTPALSGKYPVGTTDLHLVDPGRADPWKPEQRRELMVTVTYPARPGAAPRAAWMTPGVAGAVDALASSPAFLGLPRGSVDWGGVRRQARVDAAVDRSSSWPVVLFSPGLTSVRELNAGLTDDLASRGYVVVSLSHTHESGAVEFPGGRVETALADIDTTAGRKTTIDTRVADTRFVLDEMTRLGRGANPDAERDPLPRGLVGSFDLSRVGMFGHSFGGYTAGEAMYRDRRIDAGVNVDGTLGYSSNPYEPGEVVKHGLDRPFLLVGGDSVKDGKVVEHSHADRTLEPTWADFWPNQRGWKRDLHFDKSTHYSFTDLQFAVPQLTSLVSPQVRVALVGSIDPERSLKAQHDYLAAYFDLHLKCRPTALFGGASPRYPDVRLIA